MGQLANIKTFLSSQGLRVTKSRLGISQVLLRNKHLYLSPEEIFKKIEQSKDFQCDLASVYRTLTTFEELGMVKKSVFRGEAARFSLAMNFQNGEDKVFDGSQPKKSPPHEHYFKCLQCDVIESFTECFVSKKERELEKSGYRNLGHHVEITGLCPKCAQTS